MLAKLKIFCEVLGKGKSCLVPVKNAGTEYSHYLDCTSHANYSAQLSHRIFYQAKRISHSNILPWYENDACYKSIALKYFTMLVREYHNQIFYHGMRMTHVRRISH